MDGISLRSFGENRTNQFIQPENITVQWKQGLKVMGWTKVRSSPSLQVLKRPQGLVP